MTVTHDLRPQDIPVVILAGGLGTRLREETERLPKPLLGIGGRPILWHIMKIYGHHGFRRFVICLGYKGWAIKQYFLNYREQHTDFSIRLADGTPTYYGRPTVEDWEVVCAETGLYTGTGGRLSRVRDYIDTDTFMFTYGDGIGSIDLPALLSHHRREGRIGTVTGVHPTSRYGEMMVDGHRVTEFNEKPTRPEGFVSGGFFVLSRGIFDYLSDDEDLFFESEPLQKLARDDELSVYPHESFWHGMDTYRDYSYLNDLWGSGDAPWKTWDD
ncbi:MAG: glucose-1-phosphate cytidylyltransferase [Actinomycetota bacterium]|nr:glucose-1-phosphate cytidylyltransferase [Actinomycetota bacterium]